MKLYEKKDHLINRNLNLTQEQKQEIIEVLNRHPSYENKIDWNKNNSLTYKDFLNILRPLYLNELDIRGLVVGEDYDLLLDKQDEQLYAVYTYEASKILASNSVGPKIWTEIPYWCGEAEKEDKAHAFGYFDEEHGKMKPGAKWCISMQTSDNYWNQYKDKFAFFFWFRGKKSLSDSSKKIAIGIDKSNWEVSVIYDGRDKEYKRIFPSYIKEAINDYRTIFKEKEKKRLLKGLTFNPSTGRYDYKGDLDLELLSYFVSEDKNGFTIDFGEVTGNFNCFRLGLTSLKGAPKKVSGNFRCSDNQLTSLEGAPKKVDGYLDCSFNQLTSLKGSPEKVGGSFSCSGNQLTSLEGAPKEVGGSFYCSSNQLTSLKGAPEKVGGDFGCSFNQLTSLKGAPEKVGGDFNCSFNQLTSLEESPIKVGGSFDCFYNQLTSLEGAPKEVGGHFRCSNNNLTSLEGAPKEVGRDFDCRYNPNLHSLDGIGEVKGEIYKNF